jgi:hypothetical protein
LRQFAWLRAWGIGLPTPAAQSNPIVIENQQPGTNEWQTASGKRGDGRSAGSRGMRLPRSVNKGENITFHVSTNPAQSCQIADTRFGAPDAHICPLSDAQQPADDRFPFSCVGPPKRGV